MAAVELMLRGVSDLDCVASVVGLPIEEVRQLESANDPRVRRLIVEGLPPDFAFRLRSAIVCPGCGSRIYLVPCMTCRAKSAGSVVDSADAHLMAE
jgi:hypothetical protein